MNNTADDITLAQSLADEAESMTMPRFTAVDLYGVFPVNESNQF